MITASNIRKTTPILVVDRIEPVISFWKKLDLVVITEVPDQAAGDGRLAFVILATQGIEIMYQTAVSVREDLLKSASVKEAIRSTSQQTILFVEVARVAEIESKLQDERLIMPRRTTFYGTTEVGYADPMGNVVVFAEHSTVAA
jgi:hypothetical protein